MLEKTAQSGNIIMDRYHDAPWLKLEDKSLLQKFFSRRGFIPSPNRLDNINGIAKAFSAIPYENLTKIIKSDSIINPRSGMRFPDELLNNWLQWGTGGTCFSLTAALIAVLNAFNIESYPVLADRYYGVDTHCGLVVTSDDGLLLIDPGYLMCFPVKLPSEEPVRVSNGFNLIELIPLQNGQKVELYTVVKGNRKLRMTYKVRFVDATEFARAWEQSFSWEMMTYPVITRSFAGKHHYLQGKKLSVRSESSTERKELSAENQMEYIASSMGINKEIVKKAFGVLNHG